MTSNKRNGWYPLKGMVSTKTNGFQQKEWFKRNGFN